MEKVDYSKHRMNDYDWIAKYQSIMGKEEFFYFLNRVYKRMLQMKTGETYKIANKVQEANRDLFIKIVCLFILEGNQNYIFSEDYTKIIKDYGPMTKKHTKTTQKRLKEIGVLSKNN